MTTNQMNPTKRKRRPRQPEIRFERHYAEPMTEQEQDELVDLIAQMIYKGIMSGARQKSNTSGKAVDDQAAAGL